MVLVSYKLNAASEGIVYLAAADKYPRINHRLSQGQKGIDERALMASQRPLSPLVTPSKLAVRTHDPASAHGNPSVPLLLSLPHTCAGCGHGGTRNSSTSRNG